MNTLKNIQVMAVALIVLCCMTGCRQWKNISKTTAIHQTVRTDSAHTSLTELAVAKTTTSVTREVRDTTIGIVPANIACEDCDDTVIRSGHITLRTYTDSKGKRHTECLADSLTLVIRGLVRERETLTQSRDSVFTLASHHASQERENSNTLTQVVQQTNRGFVFIVKHMFYILLAVLAGMALQKWIVPFINRVIQHHGRIW